MPDTWYVLSKRQLLCFWCFSSSWHRTRPFHPHPLASHPRLRTGLTVSPSVPRACHPWPLTASGTQKALPSPRLWASFSSICPSSVSMPSWEGRPFPSPCCLASRTGLSLPPMPSVPGGPGVLFCPAQSGGRPSHKLAVELRNLTWCSEIPGGIFHGDK